MNILNNLNDYKNKYVVYLLTFPNQKKYCGYSSNIKRRWSNSNQYKDCDLVYNAIQKYGWNNIEAKILASFNNKQQALEAEKIFIESEEVILFK